MSKFRDEEVTTLDKFKDVKFKMVKRKFIKESSVFAYWKLDDMYVFKKCLDHDFRYWKCQRFIKNPSEYESLKHAIKMHFPVIKGHHLWMCCNSVFPASNIHEFMKFAETTGIKDKVVD